MNYPNKVYVTYYEDTPLHVFKYKDVAHGWLEDTYDNKEGLSVVSYVLTVPNEG